MFLESPCNAEVIRHLPKADWPSGLQVGYEWVPSVLRVCYNWVISLGQLLTHKLEVSYNSELKTHCGCGCGCGCGLVSASLQHDKHNELSIAGLLDERAVIGLVEVAAHRHGLVSTSLQPNEHKSIAVAGLVNECPHDVLVVAVAAKADDSPAVNPSSAILLCLAQ